MPRSTRRAVSTQPPRFESYDLPGRRVFSVCGPGDSPTEIGAYRSGLIVGLGEDRWGEFVKVIWDDEPCAENQEPVHGLKDPKADKGIGLYVGGRVVPSHQVQLAFAVPPTASVH